MNLKFKIAELIASGTYHREKANYQELIEAIYNNKYKAIEKCPIDLYILGIVETFVIKDLEHVNKILNTVKKVTKEVFETTGVELTFTDEDWNNLQLIDNPNFDPKISWNNKPYILPKINKYYMSEFFEN